MNKVVKNADEAIRDMQDGAVIMSGGFGLSGNPENLIAAIHRKGVKNLTVISNNCGTTDKGLGVLLQSRQVRKMIASYVGENKEFERQFLAGELEVELNPQGTRTQIAQGKESRVIEGREMIFEKPLKADYAIVRAWKGDRWGNLVFRKTARNFSPMMCTAARITIAEVEHLVDIGELDGDQIHVPSIYVKRIFQGSNYQKWIEKRTVRPS